MIRAYENNLVSLDKAGYQTLVSEGGPFQPGNDHRIQPLIGVITPLVGAHLVGTLYNEQNHQTKTVIEAAHVAESQDVLSCTNPATQ